MLKSGSYARQTGGYTQQFTPELCGRAADHRELAGRNRAAAVVAAVKGLMICGHHRAQEKRTGHLRKAHKAWLKTGVRCEPPKM